MSDMIFENWSEIKTALTSDLPQTKREIVESLLENQKQQILTETAAGGAVNTGDIAGFRKILIPMIRRIIPNTIATEIVGVQPMKGPVGLVYSMKYTYEDSITYPAGSFPPGVNGINTATDDEAFGNVNAIRQYYSGASDAGAQLPGAGGFDPANPITGNGATGGGGWGSALDAAAVGSRGGAGPLYGGGSSYLEGSGGRKMGLKMTSQAIESKSRKLQAGWTIEAMQDMQSQHGLDIENEMTQALSAEIIQEIDNEIITDLIGLAGTVLNFDGSVPTAPGYYRPTMVADRLANLGVTINYAAQEIARKTRRGPGNFMVLSPMMVSVLQSAAKTTFAPAVQGSFKSPTNTALVGKLNGTIDVYSYLWNQSVATGVTNNNIAGTGNDTILVGYKSGNGETDSGYFYCPYIPLMSSGVIINPNTFQPTVSLMTRYGKASFTDPATALVNHSNNYYAKINVTDMSLS
jgi:hypothetical protein